MSKEDIEELVSNLVKTRIEPVYLKMLADSEKRVERISELMLTLAETCATNQAMYDKHLTSLEASRNKAQENNSDLIRANMEQVKFMEQTRADYKAIIQGYRDELQSAKRMYQEMMGSYARVAESSCSGKGTTNKTEVTVQK